jgi:RNA polymerase sigma-70 factor (ECF subfamily)
VQPRRDENVERQIVALLPRLRRFAMSLTGNLTDADDLVQDTVERALKNISRWEPGTRLDSWLYRIAQNRFIDGVRQRRQHRSVPESETDRELSVDGTRTAEARLMLAEAVKAMQALPDEQRVVASLVLVEGFGYQETADILNVPIGTVTSRLARAREALAARLNPTTEAAP